MQRSARNFAPVHEVLCHPFGMCVIPSPGLETDIPSECGSIGSHHSSLDMMYLPHSFSIPLHLHVSIKRGAKQGSKVGSYLSLPLHQINVHTRSHGHRVLAIVKGWHQLALCKLHLSNSGGKDFASFTFGSGAQNLIRQQSISRGGTVTFDRSIPWHFSILPYLSRDLHLQFSRRSILPSLPTH